MTNQWECKTCGHVGYQQWVHNDDKCEKCYSGQIVEITDKLKENIDTDDTNHANSLTISHVS